MCVKNSNDKLPIYNEHKLSNSKLEHEVHQVNKKDSTSSITPEMIKKVNSFFDNFEVVSLYSIGCMSRQYFVKPKGSKTNKVYILKCVLQKGFGSTRKKWKAMAEKYIGLEKGTDNIDWY